jgi:Histidine kinase-like ATPase domain
MVRSMDAAERMEIKLPLEPESAQRARSAIAPLRAQAEISSFDDVRLLVSELVCDALATEPRPADGAITVEAEVSGGMTQVRVRFDGLSIRLPATKPRPAEPGWGVYLVQTLATRWGAGRENGNTYVWFEA